MVGSTPVGNSMPKMFVSCSAINLSDTIQPWQESSLRLPDLRGCGAHLFLGNPHSRISVGREANRVAQRQGRVDRGILRFTSGGENKQRKTKEADRAQDGKRAPAYQNLAYEVMKQLSGYVITDLRPERHQHAERDASGHSSPDDPRDAQPREH